MGGKRSKNCTLGFILVNDHKEKCFSESNGEHLMSEYFLMML